MIVGIGLRGCSIYRCGFLGDGILVVLVVSFVLMMGCCGVAEAATSDGDLEAPAVAVKKAGGCRFSVGWGEVPGKASGYVVRYASSKSMKGARKDYVRSVYTTRTAVVVEGKRKSVYFVQVRACKKFGAAWCAGSGARSRRCNWARCGS